MHALQLILSVCPIALQTQKAWEARREYDQKQAEAAADEAGSFRGPDGSNQWVSVGELGAEALDDALMGLAGGSGLYSMYRYTKFRGNIVQSLCEAQPHRAGSWKGVRR